ncbi:MAG: DUF3168 domain-containing protein [Maricaulaceae bacterium]
MSVAKGPAIIANILHQYFSQDPLVVSLFGNPPRIYDYTPEDPVYPYMTYGTVRSEDRSADEVEILSHTVTLHLWSRYSGRAEVLDLLSTLSDRLDAIPNQQGDHKIIGLNVLYVDVFRARDNRTQHGLIRLSVQTETQLTEANS